MSIQNILNCDQSEEDVVCALMYIASLPTEVLTERLESASKLMFQLMTQKLKFDFCTHLINNLTVLKKKNYVDIPYSHTCMCRMHVQDKFMFQVVLFTSLKYNKCLFSQSDNKSDTKYLQNILEQILDTVCLDKFQSLQLLKLIEMILKKREDILTPDLSLSILKYMNTISFSPLTGFKHCAHNISRIVIKSVPQYVKKYLQDFEHFPVKGIDLNDILNLIEGKEFRNSSFVINNRILKLFCNNTDSREGSFYYEKLLSFYSFDEFTEHIWPFYGLHLEHIDEGEFCQSFLKYWIPITVSRYNDDFYVFINEQNVDHYFKAHTLLELKKKCHYRHEFDQDALNFLKFPGTSTVGLKIVCTYMKKNIYPDNFEIQAVKSYLDNFSEFELSPDVLKCLKQFISQIFFVSHLTLSKNSNVDLNLYKQFLNCVYKFCSNRLNDKECCESSAQLLKIVWDIACGSSQDLTTSYKIDRENAYDSENNLYYLQLKTTMFWEKTFADRLFANELEDFFKTKIIFCPNLITLIKERYLNFIDLNNFQSLDGLLQEINQSICLQTSEKMRIYTDVLISYKKIKGESYEDDIKILHDIFNSKLKSLHSQDLFSCVLILDIFITVIKYEEVDLVPLLEKCFRFFENVFEENLHSNFDVKATKVLESFINNVIECLTSLKNHWLKFHKDNVLNQLCKIIQKSNMKRPVSLTINAVHQFGVSMEENECDREIKIKLLNRTLNSLYYNKQSGKIRRNPETRLVIHALCLSDKHLTKPYLVWSLNFMLDVLSNPSSSDYTLSATLHSLEVLVSDNSIHQCTLPFMTKIIKHCVKLFNRTSWIIRNADLQLLKSIIERFLGVLLDYNVRPKTVEDVFTLFPNIVEYFYEILSQPCLNDSAIVVMLFFSESQIKNNIFMNDSLKCSIEKFRFLFANVIKTYSNNFGILALKSLTSLCIDKNIPQLFSETVYYIQRHFVQIHKNIFVNLIKLLQELYQKYKSSLINADSVVIDSALADLLKFLKRFNCFYFNLLSLKLLTVKEAISEIILLLDTNLDYKSRVWLNNHLPYVLLKINIIQLPDLLYQILLLHEIPEFLQIQILSVLVDRLNDRCHPISDVMNILILKLSKLNDCSNFLVMSYSKVILLYYELAQNLNSCHNILNDIRQDFGTDCIYKILIYVVVLAHFEDKTVDDEKFINKCTEKYKEAVNGDNDEVLVDLAATMKHLYKVSSLDNKFDIMKLTMFLLLNESTAFEMCKFVSFLTNSQCCSVIISAASLLKFKDLSIYLGGERSAVKFLLEFYYYINSLPDEFEQSETYYLIENEFSIPRHYIKKIILKSLSTASTF